MRKQKRRPEGRQLAGLVNSVVGRKLPIEQHVDLVGFGG